MDIVNILSTSMAENLHYISFALLLLAGLNFPVSEDLVFIISASIAATIIPENKYIIFAGCYLGAFLSDIIAYNLGRHGLPLLFKTRFFNSKSTRKKIVMIESYFNKYGGVALFVGRFIPFGVRNMIFLTAGMVKFNYLKFAFIDLAALSITSTLLFYLGFIFGENIEIVQHYIANYRIIAFILLSILVLIFLFSKFRFKSK
jgi:membrane protein DedA with SNARE-associated domain